MSIEPLYIVVDLFCGAGGTTTGFAMAKMKPKELFLDELHLKEIAGYDDNTIKNIWNKRVPIVKVIACVNHDAKAIKSHWLNHPEVKHYNEDIRTLDLTELISLVAHYKQQYPKAKLILWASLECTNFSKAKGGMPRDADSRTLAHHLERYILALNPDYIQIENVVEFRSWGPLDDNGKPISRKNGSDWNKWRNDICMLGYYDQWQEMNSANFGSYTSRNRLFGIFAKHKLPIAFPEPTHAKNPSKNIDLFGTPLKKWKAVKDVLNFDDEGESIFNRKKPLSDNTLIRIYAGLIKYVANGNKSFLSNYKSGHPASKNSPLDTVCGTVTTIPTHALIQSKFLLKYNSTNGKTGVHHPPSVESPSPVISCQNRLGLVQANFIDYYYGISAPSSMETPCKTLTTKDRCSLIQPKYFIYRDYKSVTNSSIEEPAGTLPTVPKINLIEATPRIQDSTKYFYLINPQFNNGGSSIEKPCFTLIAKMDKRPPYLIETHTGHIGIQVDEKDSEMTIKIKQFMSVYGLIDIKMRMLRVEELIKIQGFPSNYKLLGTQADQKKFIGNSVEPNVVKHWIIAMAKKLYNIKNIK